MIVLSLVVVNAFDIVLEWGNNNGFINNDMASNGMGIVYNVVAAFSIKR